ncbi:MAG TPA: hypothetical protein VM287_06430 [Egibacteraceae bacterium]|nr:hypothetical protein [Egibacteraceae bacterium]
MRGNQLAVLLLGVSAIVVGTILRRFGRQAHRDAKAKDQMLAIRMDMKAIEVMGVLLVAVGAIAAAGSVVGALFWP